MSSLDFQTGDDRWQILRKILQRLPTVEAYLTSIASGVNALNVTQAFADAPDITVAVAGTAVQGSSVATPNGVLLVAAITNTGSVYVGGATVTNASGSRRGAELVQAGMPSMKLTCTNLNQIWVNADNANDKVGVVIL
jgi:hypothetical protein